MKKEPKTPDAISALSPAARQLYREVTDAFELRADEQAILESACRLRSEIDCLEAALAKVDTLTLGSGGQERVHPLFAEVRHHRLALARLLAQLGVADEDADSRAIAAKSAAGRRLAKLRWGGRGVRTTA